MTLDGEKTIIISQASTGFSITVKRMIGAFFKFDLIVTQNPEAVQGLCTNTTVVKETEVEPDPTASVTHVSYPTCDDLTFQLLSFVWNQTKNCDIYNIFAQTYLC